MMIYATQSDQTQWLAIQREAPTIAYYACTTAREELAHGRRVAATEEPARGPAGELARWLVSSMGRAARPIPGPGHTRSSQ